MKNLNQFWILSTVVLASCLSKEADAKRKPQTQTAKVTEAKIEPPKEVEMPNLTADYPIYSERIISRDSDTGASYASNVFPSAKPNVYYYLKTELKLMPNFYRDGYADASVFIDKTSDEWTGVLSAMLTLKTQKSDQKIIDDLRRDPKNVVMELDYDRRFWSWGYFLRMPNDATEFFKDKRFPYKHLIPSGNLGSYGLTLILANEGARIFDRAFSKSELWVRRLQFQADVFNQLCYTIKTLGNVTKTLNKKTNQIEVDRKLTTSTECNATQFDQIFEHVDTLKVLE